MISAAILSAVVFIAPRPVVVPRVTPARVAPAPKPAHVEPPRPAPTTPVFVAPSSSRKEEDKEKKK